jgi:beta-lactamase regulating signal transducer with metallopeptidase domain
MLWQSSLLIALVLALDLLVGNRVRAAVRYALWLIVLLKLLLPPSLALPSGLAWWLPNRIPIAPQHPQKSIVAVRHAAPTPATFPTFPVSVRYSTPTRLSSGAYGLLASSCVSLGLLGFVMVRWRGLMRVMRRGTEPPNG